MVVEIVASPIITALVTTLRPFVTEKIPNVWGVKKDMVKLGRILDTIQSVIRDAEKQQLGSDKDAIKLWLQDLDDVAREAEDIMDEFEYVVLRDEIETRKRKRVIILLTPSTNPLTFNGKMHFKIVKLNKRLEQISKDKQKFKFVVGSHAITTARYRIRETKSFNFSEVVGREAEVSKVIDLLINSSGNYSIIRIVGMGGVGKTTLAQSIFFSDILKDHFEIKKWVCVSQYSKEKEIYNQLLDSEERRKFDNLDDTVRRVTGKLQNKRCLIVLDDMWKDGVIEWDDIMETLLNTSAPGSRVIVTTRSNDVPSNRSSLFSFSLFPLSDDVAWTLLEKIAFAPGGIKKKPGLLTKAQNIARKCGGVPLAIKVLGSLLYSERSEQAWQSIESNEVWHLPEGDNKKVIGILKLSYDYLEPQIKQCFKYCSLFPKDQPIVRKKIIMLWMAEGLLNSSRSSEELEKVGNEYFNSLVRNSLLQEEKKDKLGDIKSCRMHDLVHDLAESLSKTECSRISNNRTPADEDDKTRLRRVFLLADNETDFTSCHRKLSGAKKLRAFLYTAPKINSNDMPKFFKKFSYLRILVLSNNEISKLPSSIGNLKHLRYLDLSDNPLATLPDSVTILYNLQSLILKNCFALQNLPQDMRKLTKLRHLIIRITGLDKWNSCNLPMPSQVRYLTSLRYMPVYTVGNGSGFGIEELKELNLLRGKLHILNLENVSNRKDAEGAALNEKQHILRLELHWTKAELRKDAVGDDFEVLEGLQPHKNLTDLGIHNYIGSRFSTWMMSDPITFLPNLTSIILKDCSHCEALPPLGLLPFLKLLQIQGLESVKRIGDELYGSSTHSSVSSFRSLEYLSICHLENLVEWHDNISSSSSSAAAGSSFPCLRFLRVKYCSKLTVIPTRFPSLEVLEFEDLNGESISSVIERNLTSLISVKIRQCEDLVFLPRRLLTRNTVLRELELNECESFEGFSIDQESDEGEEEEGENEIQLLPNSLITHLKFYRCPALISLPSFQEFNSLVTLSLGDTTSQCMPRGIERLPHLYSLIIGTFEDRLDYFSFPAPNIDEEGKVVGPYFPALQSLSLFGWIELESLPEHVQYITSLKALDIQFFRSLVALPEWLGNLTSLEELYVAHCTQLKHLPSKEQMLRLTSLRTMKLLYCPLMLDRCEVGGAEYHKRSHLTKNQFSCEEFDADLEKELEMYKELFDESC